MHIGWKVTSLDSNMASVRYRAVFPILALGNERYKSRIFSSVRCKNLDDLNLLVFVKSFSAEDLCLAQEARMRSIPFLLDLCDNIFIETYKGSSLVSPAQFFRLMARLSSGVVVTTKPLAEIVRKEIGSDIPIHIIADSIETRENVAASVVLLNRAAFLDRPNMLPLIRKRLGKSYGNFREWIKKPDKTAIGLLRDLMQPFRPKLGWKEWLRRTFTVGIEKKILASIPRLQPEVQAAQPVAAECKISLSTRNLLDTKKILWFGNHGAKHAKFGMLDLLEIQKDLENVAREFPVELVVISNNLRKFQKYIQPFAMQTCYVEWAPGVVEKFLSDAKAVIIPNARDDFSICKSANRSVLALTYGVPVVATLTPALEQLKPAIAIDNFYEGLKRYLADEDKAKADVVLGRSIIQQCYGSAAIAGAWQGVFEDAISKQHKVEPTQPQLIVALNLIQDLDLAIPVLEQCAARRIDLEVWCSAALLKKSPRVLSVLLEKKYPYRAMPDDIRDLRKLKLPETTHTLLTMSESNLGPHRFTRDLSKLASAQGVFVATMQHGFENIGLTYSDEEHPANRINFAAHRIYLWGPMETLHKDVLPSTRGKCVSVGCPKLAIVPPADLSNLIPPGKEVIGVFENLHWHRYSPSYKKFFIKGVLTLAENYPDIIFLLKPHHAGLWLTSRHKGDKSWPSNIIIADPQAPEWEAHTAAALMGRLKAVITSPSTVALDAARMDLPVALVSNKLEVENYRPLRLIRHHGDWVNFMNECLSEEGKGMLLAKSRKFVLRTLVRGNAAERIVNDLLSTSAASKMAVKKSA